MTASHLLAAFAEGHGEPIADELALAPHLDAAVTTGRAAWPDLTVDPIAWMRALGVLVPAPLVADPFAALVLADLYLAHACGTGDPRAVAACDALLVREAGYAQAAANLHASVRDEAVQMVRTIAFSPRAERAAAICDYAGRGSLAGWLRVLVAREMVRIAKAQQKSTPLEDRMLDIPAVDADPVLEELKTKYRTELADAFRASLDQLSSRDRTLMRYQLIDGLTIDDIGKLYRVHRATAARWLAAIRDGLVERTRERLATVLGVNTREAASIIRLVQSQLDVSVIRHLEPRRR